MIEKLRQARCITDGLFDLIREKSLYDRPIPRRHRLIFYLGHLEAFDWNHIGVWNLSQPALHPSFDKLFEAGIDPGSDNLPTDQAKDWPAIDEVRTYVRQVRAKIDILLLHSSPEVAQMALEHRLMHAETLSYLLHAMAHTDKTRIDPAENAGETGTGVRDSSPVEIPAGEATLGRARENGFGWDNEFEEVCLFVPTFVIDRHKVTNRDYLRFVEEGGTPPHYWEQHSGRWFWRGMFDSPALPLDWPVYVTREQAAAFAEWAGKRLPTEAEFHRAAFGTLNGKEREYPWGNEAPSTAHGNFAFARFDPVPVTAHKAGASFFGVEQLVGNGWEWTSTPFAPFAGFQPAPNYPGYSANFFDGEHFVLKGASPQTSSVFLRRSFRNFFRPDYPYVYATFRCVEL
jgi:formylglycine-generating enzyme required for sulfatase activity